MNVLLDTCVAASVKAELAAEGYNVVWAGEFPTDPGDEALLDRAYSESRILITLDKDFGELAIVYGKLHAGIIRLVEMEPGMQAQTCIKVLTLYGSELSAGAIITAYANRVRIRLAYTDH